MEQQLIQTWQVHSRINLYLLAVLCDDALRAAPAPRGRSAGQLCAHMQNVRPVWLKASAPDLLESAAKRDPAACTREQIASALQASGGAIESLLRRSAAAGGRVKYFKPHAVAFAAYLIAHDSHHRGQMTAVLKQAGYPLVDKTDYGMREWGAR